jgi:Leucine-rich repeat (LRR) protein
MEIDLFNQGLKGVLNIEQYCKNNNIDAEKVTSFVCDNNKLTELKGLDKLVNLEKLYCYNNELIELDVNNLVNLEWLWCSNNKFTEIKGLDNLVNLQWLNCYNNELLKLKGLDKLVNLKWLSK